MKISSFKNILFVKDRTISKKGDNRTFSLTYESLGEPSCALVWLTSGLNSSKQVSYGTNESYCKTLNPSVSFAGIYNTSNRTLTFKLMMWIEGLVNVYFMIKNDFESLKLTTTATVSSIPCNRPLLDIQNRASDFLNPMIMKRAQMLPIVGLTILDCNTSLINTKKWFVYELYQNNGSIAKKVSLATIISEVNAELFIPNNFLSYGTYRIVYRVNMVGEASSFIEETETFLRIVPTGFAVFPFSGGIKKITIAVEQSLVLDPGRYSYDFDEILSGTSISFNFYCRTVENGVPGLFPIDSLNMMVSLRQIKYDNVSLQYTESRSCFTKTGLSN